MGVLITGLVVRNDLTHRFPLIVETLARGRRFFVVSPPVRDLLLRAKHLFVAARIVWQAG
jgi:hypothetical protein